jgi:hypothetical protein
MFNYVAICCPLWNVQTVCVLNCKAYTFQIICFQFVFLLRNINLPLLYLGIAIVFFLCYINCKFNNVLKAIIIPKHLMTDF